MEASFGVPFLFCFLLMTQSNCELFGPAEFFGRRLRTSMTRATVEDSTTGLGQNPPVRDVHLFGGLSFPGVSGVWTKSLARRLPEAFRFRLGQMPVIHTPWVAISVVSSAAPTLSTAQQQRTRFCLRK